MTESLKVAVLVGSLRKDSYSGKIADALAALAPRELSLVRVELGNLPLYNPDLEGDAPEAWRGFRASMGEAQAVLFITPEYNRSVPAALKNALDVGSRPYGHSVFDGKPAGIVSQSPGFLGGFGANHALRQSLVFLNMPVVQQPELYLSQVDQAFEANGSLTSEPVRALFLSFLTKFAEVAASRKS